MKSNMCSSIVPVTKCCNTDFKPEIKSIELDFSKATGIHKNLIKEIEISHNAGNPKPGIILSGNIKVQNGGRYTFEVTGDGRIKTGSLYRIS